MPGPGGRMGPTEPAGSVEAAVVLPAAGAEVEMPPAEAVATVAAAVATAEGWPLHPD